MDKLASLSIMYFLIGGGIISALIHLSKLDTQSQIKTKIESAKGQVSTSEKQLQNAQNLEQDKPKLEADIIAKKEMFQAALETMPLTTNHREILEAISNEAKMAGVRIVQLKPKEVKEAPKEMPVVNTRAGAQPKEKPVSTALHDESQYDIELEASYTQLTYLFYLLTKIKNNVGFKNVSVIKKDTAEGVALLSFRAILIAFRYKEPPPPKPATPAKPAPAKPAPAVKK